MRFLGLRGMANLSVVIDNHNVRWSGVGPSKADPPLLVDADTILATAPTSQLLQLIAWWCAHVVQNLSGVKYVELAHGNLCNRLIASSGLSGLVERLGFSIREALDHRGSMRYGSRNVKQSIEMLQGMTVSEGARPLHA